MKSGFHNSGWLAALLAKVALAGSLLASATLRSEAAESPPAATQVVNLEYREVDFSYINWGLRVVRQSVPFKHEPAFGAREILRGRLTFGNHTNQEVPFAWDYRQGKLYLDLNRDQDLTNDPQGAYAIRSERLLSRNDYVHQTFSNVALRFKTAAGDQKLLFDLSMNFYRKQLNCYAGMRSYWDGKITLQGQEWEIGLIENTPQTFGVGEPSHLLLRPWKMRGDSFTAYSGSLTVFNYSSNLFFLNQAYELSRAYTQEGGSPRCALTLKEVRPKLGELQITGQYLQRVVFSGGRYTVVLDKPESLVKVPAGSYAQCFVQLQQGKAEAYRDTFGRDLGKAANITTDRTTALVLGGPLTNVVTVDRRAGNLLLNHQLVGADGARYRLATQDRSNPPLFKVYRGDRVVGSGKFEFG